MFISIYDFQSKTDKKYLVVLNCWEFDNERQIRHRRVYIKLYIEPSIQHYLKQKGVKTGKYLPICQSIGMAKIKSPKDYKIINMKSLNRLRGSKLYMF